MFTILKNLEHIFTNFVKLRNIICFIKIKFNIIHSVVCSKSRSLLAHRPPPPCTGKQFRGSGYHNFLGDIYQQTYTYQLPYRQTIWLLELHRTAKIKCHVTCDIWHVTSDMWHVICDMWHIPCEAWYVTTDIWHVICDMWYLTCDMCSRGFQNFFVLLLYFCTLKKSLMENVHEKSLHSDFFLVARFFGSGLKKKKVNFCSSKVNKKNWQLKNQN